MNVSCLHLRVRMVAHVEIPKGLTIVYAPMIGVEADVKLVVIMFVLLLKFSGISWWITYIT